MINHYFSGRYREAIDAADRLIRLRPDRPNPYRFRAAALGQMGRIEEAREALRHAIAISHKEFWGNVRTCPPYWRQSDYEHMLDGLRKAGLDELE